MGRITVLCGLLVAANGNAEVLCALGPGADTYSPARDERPSADVMQLAKRVNAALAFVCSRKCPEIAVFRNTTAANAMLIVTDDQAKIVYAPQFFRNIYDAGGDGAIIAAIAHEYGHALAETYPAQWMKNNWPVELRADAWSGCALAKSRISAKELQQALAAISKFPPSIPQRPPLSWNIRLSAVRLGYMHCGGSN